MKFHFYTTIIIASIFCSTLVAQDSDDIIHWTKRYRLTFTDFKGKLDSAAMVNDSTSNDFIGASVILKSILSNRKTVGNKSLFTIYPGMNRDSSWIKTRGDTASLKHEQAHFDICEIYARILRREIRNATSRAEAKKIYDQISKEQALEDDKFDSDNSGTPEGINSYWQERIKTRLRELSEYENPEVLLPFVE